MPRMKSTRIKKDWIPRIENHFESMIANGSPISRTTIKKLLKHKKVGLAYENLVKAGGENNGYDALVIALEACAYLSEIFSDTQIIPDHINAKRRAVELRSAKAVPFQSEDDRHHLEVLARFYDFVSGIPSRRGVPEEDT